MVAAGVEAVKGQVGAHPLHPGAGGAVDNAALALALVEQPSQHSGFFRGFQGLYLKVQVGPVEAGDQGEGGLEPQLLNDVPAYRLGGGGGKGPHHRPLGQLREEEGNLPVAGPKILPPLGDAVGLIHRQQGDLQSLGGGDKTLALQPFRSHIDDFVSSSGHTAVHRGHLSGRQGGVQIGGGNSGVLQSHDLILHQGDQWGYHQSHSRQQQSGDLIAYRFAPAGGHDPQHIPAGAQAVHQLLLSLPKSPVAEILF